MDKYEKEENLILDLEKVEENNAQTEPNLMDDANLEEIPIEDISDEDLSDDKLLEGIQDNSVLLDALKQYLISIGKYRLLTHKEQLELARKSQNGDMEARELLIVHNLRLVVLIAKKLFKYARRLELIDLIQEGNIGLMKAIEKYDPNLNHSFITYAYRAIFQKIQRAINEKDSIMYTPEWVQILYQKYKKFRQEYIIEYGIEPPKEVVKEKYKIKDDTYRALVNFENNVLNPRSLDEKIDDGDKDTDSLENFVPDIEIGYERLNEEIDKRIYMKKLRDSLSPFEYYIVYYRLLDSKVRSLEKIGEVFGITRETIRQKESIVINKAKTILKSNRVKKTNISMKQIFQENFIPPSVEDVAVLTHLKEELDEDDYYIFYHIWYKKENVNDVARRLAVSAEEIKDRVNYVIKSYPLLTTDREYARDEFLALAKKYGASKVYNQIENLEPTFNPLKEIAKIVNRMNYNQARRMVGNLYDAFNEKEKKAFDRYFDQSFTKIYPSILEEVCAKINVFNSHYFDSPYIDKKKLYQVMLDNQDKYSVNIIDYLKKTYFKEESGYDGESPIGLSISYYLNLFERLYYDLNGYGTYFVPKEDVERIVYGTKYRFTDEEKEIMTLKYGLKGIREHTLNEMVEKYGIDYIAMHDKYHAINDRVIDIYVGRHVQNNYSNPERYAKYINDNRYIMTDETREVSRLYFLEGKTYKEIVEIMGIRDTTRVSNILTDAARKMDFWYYGMIDFSIYEPDLVEKVFDSYNFTDIEKDAIRLRTNEGITRKDINYILGIESSDKFDFQETLQRFNNYYVYLYGKDLVTVKDIREQLVCHISDSILDEKERLITALIYGIKCSYNPEGVQYLPYEVAKKLGYTEYDFDNKVRHIKHYLRGHKLGLINAPFTEITHSELKKILKDPHLPISDYEKELLASVKGINGRVYSIPELMDKYGINGCGSIARRINRAILSIKKYQAGEIDKKIIYDIDIAPILKYFGEYHRKIINMRYRDNMLVKDMAKKLGVSKSAMDSYISKIERKILYLLKNPKAKKFDYDYAREVIHRPDLPFYGNFDVAYKYYLRMSGEDGERPGGEATIDDEEVVDQKGKPHIHYYLLMTAVLKYRDGMRKVKQIDVDDLEKFYLENKDNYSKLNQKLFEKTINNLRKTVVFGKKYFSTYVINEYMKGRGMSTFSFDNMTKDEAKKFLRDNPYNLSKSDLEKVRNYFRITHREIMPGKMQFKVLKMIEPAALELHQKNKEKLASIIQKGRDDASKYRVIKTSINSQDINAFALVKYLKLLEGMDNGVLITSPILDLVYAHIKANHNNIDVLTIEDIYSYAYQLQKIIMQYGTANDLHKFFSRSLYPGSISKIKNKNPKVLAFFDELLTNHENADMLKLKYNKRDSAAISPQYYNQHFNALKNRVKKANVCFVEDIPDKLYSVINLGDEIMTSEAKVAREILAEYQDYLVNDGKLISYFKSDELIPEIFDGEKYKVLNVRTPRVGINSGANSLQDKVVIMQKTHH